MFADLLKLNRPWKDTPAISADFFETRFRCSITTLNQVAS
jgi:hypothetical protein